MKVEHFSSDDLEAFFFSKKCNTRLSHENKIKEEFLSFKNVDIVKKEVGYLFEDYLILDIEKYFFSFK